MEKVELYLTELVRLHYAGDSASFDQSMRNALSAHHGPSTGLSDDCRQRLSELVPEPIRMGNVLR